MDQGISDIWPLLHFFYVFLSGIGICVCLIYISKALYLLNTTDCYAFLGCSFLKRQFITGFIIQDFFYLIGLFGV